MKIPFGKPIVGKREFAAVLNVLKSGKYVHGSKSVEFEKNFRKFTKSKYAISVSSCTAGMHLFYFALGLKSLDEVILPAQTHVATAHAIELTGAKPVFVDSEIKTGNIDINQIEKAITKKTKAIVVVHYLGVPVDMPKVMSIAKKHKLFVLEDCALSLGAKVDNIHTGLHGHAGVFSFYPVKHITTAEGGMVITNNKNLAKKIKLQKAFGVNRNYNERKIPGLYDAIALGFNYRMSELHASIGTEQMKKISFFLEKRFENHREISKLLDQLDSVTILPAPNNRLKSSHYCLCVILNKSIAKHRAKIMNELTKKGIGSSIYYPHPVPRLSYYKKKYDFNDRKFINASRISDCSIALPVGPHLSKKDMKSIAKQLILAIKNYLK
jgi:dTDP-4-amino-4,6-dideoxygalactose transaminase